MPDRAEVTVSERYLHKRTLERVAELEAALRGLIECHGLGPSHVCGYLAEAEAVLDDD